MATTHTLSPEGFEQKSEGNECMKCQLCQAVFNADPNGHLPRRLSCHHTFCSRCVQMMISSSPIASKELGCPRCRKNTDLPSGVESCEINEDVLKSTCVQCELCENPAVIFCKNCNACLCASCSDQEHTTKLGKRHEFMDITSNTFCKEHQNEHTYFCLDCKHAICDNCTQQDHSGHVVQGVTNSSVTRRSEPGTPTKKVRSMLVQKHGRHTYTAAAQTPNLAKKVRTVSFPETDEGKKAEESPTDMEQEPQNGVDFDSMSETELFTWCYSNGIDISLELPLKRENMLKVVKQLLPLRLNVASNEWLESQQADYVEDSKELLEISQRVQYVLRELPKSLEKTELMIKKESQIPMLRDSLKENRCRILVFGDVKSGKSLLVNLLLQKKLLYTSDLPASSTVCEIVYSENKELWTTCWGETTETKVDINFDHYSDDDLPNVIRSFVAEPRKYNDSDPNAVKFKYSKVTLKWPVNLLKQGVILVDSPGLNESTQWLDQVVKEYIPMAHGTICLIDCTSGITQSLADFLALVQNTEGFDPNSLFFICSKIDRVNPTERQACIDAIWDRLQSLVDLVSENHFFPVNLLAATNVQSAGLQSPEYASALEAIVQHLGFAFHLKLKSIYYKLNSTVLTYEKTLKLAKRGQNRTREEQVKVFESVSEKFSEISENKRLFVRRLQISARRRQAELVAYIQQHLQQQRERMIQDTEQLHLPDTGSEDLSDLHKFVQEFVTKEVMNEVRQLEQKEQKCHRAQTDFAQEATKLFKELLFEVDEAQLKLLGNDCKGLVPEIIDENDGSIGDIVLKIVAVPGFIVLGAVAVVSGIIGFVPYGLYRIVVFTNKRNRLKIIRREPKHFLNRIAQETLDDLIDEPSTLCNLVAKNFLNVELLAKQLLDSLEELVNHYQELMTQLFFTNSTEDAMTRESYEGYQSKIADISERLIFFHLTHFKKFAVNWDDIEFPKDHRLSPLKLSRKRMRKAYYNPTKRKSRESVLYSHPLLEREEKCDLEPGTEIMLKWVRIDKKYPLRIFYNEERILRQFHSDYVVQVYGACRNELDLYLVYEFVGEQTLEEYYFSKPVPTPQNDFGDVLHIATCIAKGLQYVHTQNLMHRNLSPTAITISSGSTPSVKLVDFGLAIETADSGYTFAGTDAFMAPEIGYGVYDRRMDIYALGMLFWWLWHREHPFDGKTVSMEQIIDNWRPLTSEDCPAIYAELFQRCWHADPNYRPTLEDIMEELEFISKVHLEYSVDAESFVLPLFRDTPTGD